MRLRPPYRHGAKDSLHGLKEGSEVVAHYTAKGSAETAVEVDKVR